MAARKRSSVQVARFKRRVADLVLKYVAVGRATPELEKNVMKLKKDIDVWRKRTGRSDLRATRSRLRNTDDDDWSCSECEWIMVSMGRICFLVGCDPAFNNCSYICITLPRDPDYPVS